jgi:hypothetical protein
MNKLANSTKKLTVANKKKNQKSQKYNKIYKKLKNILT